MKNFAIISAIVIIILGGLLYWNNQNNSTITNEENLTDESEDVVTETQEVEEEIKDGMYINHKYGFSFEYPEDEFPYKVDTASNLILYAENPSTSVNERQITRLGVLSKESTQSGLNSSLYNFAQNPSVDNQTGWNGELLFTVNRDNTTYYGIFTESTEMVETETSSGFSLVWKKEDIIHNLSIVSLQPFTVKDKWGKILEDIANSLTY